jgi:hypothetical protein
MRFYLEIIHSSSVNGSLNLFFPFEENRLVIFLVGSDGLYEDD